MVLAGGLSEVSKNEAILQTKASEKSLLDWAAQFCLTARLGVRVLGTGRDMNDTGTHKRHTSDVSCGLLLVFFANGAGSGERDELHDRKEVDLQNDPAIGAKFFYGTERSGKNRSSCHHVSCKERQAGQRRTMVALWLSGRPNSIMVPVPPYKYPTIPALLIKQTTPTCRATIRYYGSKLM
eukprot:scaffold6829_cov171-Amphora_coffeaeformis.AAC.16